MNRHTRIGAAVLGLTLLLAAVPTAAQAQAQAKQAVDQIRKELMQLPYYGVFDFLAFSYDNKGVVNLMGYAYHPGLKKDAERAVKRVSGVTEVLNKIEELPPSPNDDELRWKTYYAIYRDPFLSRYAPGGGMLWGHRHPFSGPFMRGGAPFPGMEPAGDYPIHLVVKNGRITLLGVVDNEGDKTIAGMKAGQVPGAFGVDNDLLVENKSTQSTKR